MTKKKETNREILEKYLLGAVTLGGSKLKEIWEENSLSPQEHQNSPDNPQSPKDKGEENP